MSKHDTERAMETQAKHTHPKPKPKPKKPKAKAEAPKAPPARRTPAETDELLEKRRLELRKRTRASLVTQRDRNRARRAA